MIKITEIEKLLDWIDPKSCSYQEWCSVGMALKDEGADVSVWESWSMRDSARYHAGECEKKWRTFRGSENPVTAGTIVQMAKDAGWQPEHIGRKEQPQALDWNGYIGDDYAVVTSPESAVASPVIEPSDENWNPAEEIIKYLETLFEAGDNVGYVTSCWHTDSGKALPTQGNFDRTAGQLIAELAKCDGDIGSVLGDTDETAGAWIHINPVDGKGVRNENITDFRYALVESDSLPLEQQNGVIHELKLPIAALVYSGGKSIHAVVKVDAGSAEEYRKRVEFLYAVCDKNGLQVDRQNKNPSRLSRLPGIRRNGKKQFLMETNIGFASWNEWKDYIDSITDELPEFENMAEAWADMPELAPPLIEGVLRQGHKMLIAGPSKAGKSFALIELAIAIAEGKKWLGWQCTSGKVLYVNLELDRASCMHRVKDVYNALKFPPQHLNDIYIWNLRGVTEPMDKLAPKLIRRAKKQQFIAVIIDPIYKVITGDENSADQMAHFCNQFDKVCAQLGCAVIYCHHHSKGGQGGKKSMDRASGSGVFARDPDAMLDLIELELTDEIRLQQQNTEAVRICAEYLQKNAPDALQEASQDDRMSRSAMLKLCCDNLPHDVYEALKTALSTSDKDVTAYTAWRLEGTLREFPKFPPKNLWFRFPVHEEDGIGILGDLQTDVELTPWQRASKNGHRQQSRNAKAKAADKNAELINTFDAVNVDGTVCIQDMANFLGVDRRSVERWLKNCRDLRLENGRIIRA